MKSSIDATYITNTLSYIHLLPLNEQIEHYCVKVLKKINIYINYLKYIHKKCICKK